jgi:hypothetical protein
MSMGGAEASAPPIFFWLQIQKSGGRLEGANCCIFLVIQQKLRRNFVRKLCRATLLPILAFLFIQAATLTVPRVYAGPVPAAASPAKKKYKYKKPKFKKAKYKATKQKVLKGHHGKHKGKPA